MSGVQTFFGAIGEVAILTGQTARELVRRPFEVKLWIVQLEQGGVQSWSITFLTAVFTGMVMASQFAIGLEPFGASLYTGKLVSLGIVRELGPVLTALLVGGRVGAGFTAEIGSMAVTEQIDAIRALGANPVRKLVVPRVVAMVIALPLLTVLADLVGCLGGVFITMLEVHISFRFGIEQMIDTVDVPDLIHGILKSAFFGYFIAIISCWVGMNTRGGTEGVGQATTRTVVWTSITILISDFFLTRFFLAIYG
ncbi:MAG: ABC transporter permease [Deltaproteobacteria bacterium]|nr:MAG: ABC transporter permease [Deltaproteobacteria bacterium]